jgi:hypothetical protein
MTLAKDRVKIWNSYFKLAWREAGLVYEGSTGKRITKRFQPRGGTLADPDLHVLGTLLLCNLAVEARVNHLIDELVAEGKLTPDEARGAQQLPTQLKWFLLPKLAGINKKLDANSRPHQAIAEICRLRNDLLHVRYASLLSKKLPPPGKVLSLFEGFVEAMEDMNVVLRRHRKAHQVIIDLGRF